VARPALEKCRFCHTWGTVLYFKSQNISPKIKANGYKKTLKKNNKQTKCFYLCPAIPAKQTQLYSNRAPYTANTLHYEFFKQNL
jgi:hypothetical protein